MFLNAQVTVLVLFGTQVLGEAYIPVHGRTSLIPSTNDLSFLGVLSRRDLCSDAFGANAQNSNCAPSQTLCCTRNSQDYPACEKHFKKGWCCVEEGGNCYVDQESVCDEDNSVLCTNRKVGVSEACCPKLTSCDPEVEASKSFVRCNINRRDLLAAEKAQEDETTTASTTSAPSTTLMTIADESTTEKPESQSSKPNSPTSAASTSDSSSSGLSGGAIAGIAIGAVAGGVAIASFAFWFLHRKRVEHKVPSQQTNPEPYYVQQMKHLPQGPESRVDRGIRNNDPVELDAY